MLTGAGEPLHPSSVTYKSIVAYDGTEFAGFQRQAPGIRTVQASIEEALTRLGWKDRSIMAAGRTDRGVHAQGQVISFGIAWKQDPEALSRALNAQLPADVAIQETDVVPDGFHPRFSATSRSYRYSIFIDARRQPLRERYALRLPRAVDVGLMSRAAQKLVGKRDFRSFGTAPIPNGPTVRTIMKAEWTEREDGLEFDIEADAFLQHMVRRIAAALIEVGRGRLTVAGFSALLEDPGSRWQGSLAAPGGLCLMKVRYPQ